MTASEKAEFDRVNALPRRQEGRIITISRKRKYPPRIYVFMHAELWRDRNRRPMVLFYAYPFLSRAMNREEIEYHHFNIRLCYHQYEDWDKLFYAEELEADELDKENPGTDVAFLEQLKSYRDNYPVGQPKAIPPIVKKEIAESGESAFMRELIANGHHYTVLQIGELLDKEQQGEKRLSILILCGNSIKAVRQGKRPI